MMQQPERPEQQQQGLEFQDVRDPAGKLLFRVADCGIIEVRQGGRDPVLVDIWRYLIPKR